MKWCNNCKKSTEQKAITNNSNGNNEFRCLICGCKNYTIQGFNMNLM